MRKDGGDHTTARPETADPFSIRPPPLPGIFGLPGSGSLIAKEPREGIRQPFPDSMRVLDATVTRRSRSGDMIGPDQRVDVMTALKAMTIWPAYQSFEEDQKGSIEVGKLADLVILSGDPTAGDPETLDRLVVTETIRHYGLWRGRKGGPA